MKAIALLSILLGTTLILNAQEEGWEGTHRIVSTTGGSFNPRKGKTFCQIAADSDQLTGQITAFGVDARDISSPRMQASYEKLRGTVRRSVGSCQLVKWSSERSWENKKGQKAQCKTVVEGVWDVDTIVGYFEQTVYENERVTATYRGVFELKKNPKN